LHIAQQTATQQADGTPPPAFSLPGRGNFYALWKFSSRKKNILQTFANQHFVKAENFLDFF
jgi:hypothetical protein